ncbi:MAG: pilus assembly protein N-terminal domain-containing protein [Acidobacteria bacterium]|jgi:Flp pilus assembly secretin CpaC|nr:pilus assembly protein N-terminal domain-containing protein [Acidobacteriota bacterium]
MKTTCLKAAALGAVALSFAAAASADQLFVETSKSIPVRINGDAASIVIGNKNIADVAVHNERLLFVTGKSYGTTNLIVFDKGGREIFNSDVMVTTNSTSLVTINRAGQSFTYDCSPNCKAVLSIGDDPDHFSALIDQQLQSQELTDGR